MTFYPVMLKNYISSRPGHILAASGVKAAYGNSLGFCQEALCEWAVPNRMKSDNFLCIAYQSVVESRYLLSMLASELGRELGWDPSTMSKRLTIYLDESRRSRSSSPYLDDLTIEQIRASNDLKEAGEAKTFRMAVQKIVGSYTEPVPPESVRQIERRLEALEQSQESLHGKLDEMLTAVQQISLESDQELKGRLTELLTYLRQLSQPTQEPDGLS